jgi:hypothetical protein
MYNTFSAERTMKVYFCGLMYSMPWASLKHWSRKKKNSDIEQKNINLETNWPFFNLVMFQSRDV